MNVNYHLNKPLLLFCFFVLCLFSTKAQLSYGSSVLLGLNKLNPSYTGNAIQVRRACDNATVNIGFNSCGDLDTVALNNFAGLQNFPLTSITTAAATAFSLRKVNCSYTGSAIRIRSTAAGTPTMDVGFTVNGDLDTAAMKAFIGSNSAYVTTWYDQTGNGRHATSILTGPNQPRIMLSGVIERQGTKPAIRFLGGNAVGSGFATANLNIYGTASCFNGVVKVNTDLTYNCFLNSSNSNFPAPLDHYNGTVVIGNGSATYSFYYPTQSLSAGYANGIWTYQASGVTAANIRMWHNGTSILTAASNSSSYGSATRPLYIGTRADYLTNLDGWVSEAITFSVIPSNTDRIFLEWTQTQYYNVSGGTALGTLPAGTLPSAFVATWYDQSGNNNNFTQVTASRQPQIINRGVVLKLGTRASVEAKTALQTNLTTTFGTAFTGNQLAANTVLLADAGSTSNLRIMSVGNSALSSADYNNANYFNVNQRGTNQFVIERNGAVNPPTTITVGNRMILSARFDGTNRQLFNNGTGSSTTADATAFNFNSIRVLHSINPGYETVEGFSGRMATFSMYYNAFSATRKTLLESNQAAYYAITISNNKYTPPSATSYISFVNGIGRESATDTVLGTRSTVGMGIKSGTVTGTDFLQSNGDYIMYGINCPVGPQTVTTNVPATVTHRWANDWYVNKTDVGTTGGNLKIYFDFADYGYSGSPGLATNYELLYRNSSAGTFAIVSGTTKSVVSSRVEFDVNATAIANGYYTIGTKNASASPLPIELLYFNAIANKNHVNLSWATATETSNNYFTIEKSKDGIEFKPLKTVKSKAVNGNSLSQLNYYDIDENPYSGISYYRLMQTDFDGVYKRSTIVDVNFDGSDVTDISVYPNPNNGQFTLSFNGFNSLQINASITIMDALGKKVYENNVMLSDGILSYQIIPTEKIAKGFYVLNCVLNGTTYTKKVVVN